MAVEFGAKLYLKDNMYATLKKNMELQKSYSQQINDTSSSISKLGKQKADPVITAHDKATEVLNSVRENIDNLSQQKALTKAEVQDEASKKVDEIVETGMLSPEEIVTPYIYVDVLVPQNRGAVK